MSEVEIETLVTRVKAYCGMGTTPGDVIVYSKFTCVTPSACVVTVHLLDYC